MPSQTTCPGNLYSAPSGVNQSLGEHALVLDRPCLLCGETRGRLVVEGPDYEYACQPGTFRLAGCEGCGHVQATPMPSPQQIPGLYPRTYYTVNPDSPLYLQGKIYKHKMRRDIRRIRSFFRSQTPQSIVDIGCGDAQRLFIFKEAMGQHVEVVGVDLMYEDKVVDRAAERGVRLVEGNVETDLSALRDGGHDLVIMSQLIEHLREPDLALQQVYRKLAPGGRVLIETPCLSGTDYWLFRRRHWGGYHIPRHTHLFRQDSLATLARQSGYRVLKQGFLPSPGFWVMSLRNRLGLNSASRSRSVFEFLNFSNLPVVGAFTAFDLARMALKMPSSTQYLLAEKA